MKKIIIKSKEFYKAILLSVMLFSAHIVLGDTVINVVPKGTKLESPLGSTKTLTGFMEKILELIVKIGTPVIILAIIYSGFLFVKAQGKPEELKTARNAILWTIIGALVILGAQAIGIAIKGTIDAF